MRTSLTCCPVAGAVILLLSSATLAQPGPGPVPGRGRGFPFSAGMIENVAEQLGLPEATMKQIRKLAYDTEKKVIELDGEMQGAFLELRRMMDEDKPDTEKTMKQVEKIGALDIRLRQEQIKLLLQVRELLTPEQRVKLRQLMPPRRPPGPFPGRGPRHPDGPRPGHGPQLVD